mgnify:CR=1 FL=1
MSISTMSTLRAGGNIEYFHGNHKIIGVLFVINKDEKDRELEKQLNSFLERYSTILPPNTLIAESDIANRILRNLINFGVLPLKEIPLDVFLKAGRLKTEYGELKISNYINPSDLYNLSLKLKNKIHVVPLAPLDPNSILFHFLLRYVTNDIDDEKIDLILHKVAKEWLKEMKDKLGGLTLWNIRRRRTITILQ